MKSPVASFRGLIDLASAQFGGRIVRCSDEFFGPARCLLEPGRGIWIDDKFTEQGKWVDGWETRRKRVAGHDWCILELGAPGVVQGLDIDTHHFSGNHPPFASVEGVCLGPGQDDLEAAFWGELLPQSPLMPSSQNLFIPELREPVSHLRLNIFPDGGVARLRAFGKVTESWPAPELDSESAKRVDPTWVDLAAAKNGGLALTCSDAYFGPMNNLIMPGRGINMGDGWETRRRRGPGYDWILLKLAARGAPKLLELDTHHFKGNYPDRAIVHGIDAPDASISDLVNTQQWQPLVEETPLQADSRCFVSTASQAPVTHMRISIFPDGGLSRFRAWGVRE